MLQLNVTMESGNCTSISNNSVPDNVTKNDNGSYSVNEQPFNREVRIYVLIVLIVFGLLGNILVCVGIFIIRSRKSRVNALVLNLTMADFSVVLFAMMPQLIMEYKFHLWTAGNFLCKLLRFSQTFSMMASTFALVTIAIDRHQAIRAPLKKQLSVSSKEPCENYVSIDCLVV